MVENWRAKASKIGQRMKALTVQGGGLDSIPELKVEGKNRLLKLLSDLHMYMLCGDMCMIIIHITYLSPFREKLRKTLKLAD